MHMIDYNKYTYVTKILLKSKQKVILQIHVSKYAWINETKHEM